MNPIFIISLVSLCICNTFFDAKKAYYENLDASYENNSVIKDSIIAKLNELTLNEDVNANREKLKLFSEEWNAAGMVPLKDKKRLNDAFYSKLDELYEQMHIDKQEKASIQYKTKLDRFAASENGIDMLRKESDYLKKSSDEINARIRTYDNNLGFFKNSKSSNSFMKEIEEKISAEKTKIEEIANKRKLINELLTKLREGENIKTEA